MTRLDIEYSDRKNGMIDYDHYRNKAAELRRESRSRLLIAVWRWTWRWVWRRLAAYFRLPQKRWMRLHASSKSSVFVA